MSDAGSGSGADPVLVEQRGEILVVTINRPEVRNAIDMATAEAIAAQMERLDTDDELRVGVLTGAGTGFSAGLDLRAFAEHGDEAEVPGRGFAGLVERGPRKPLIAAVEGFAVAGGFEIALACDLLVAARDARLGIPEVKRSLVATGGALLRLPGRVPRNVAAEMALTGDPLSAERLAELGLVNFLSEPDEALEAAVALADRIAANGPLAVEASKRILDAAPDWPLAEFWARQAEIAGPVWSSEDAEEGATAFVEKRPPRWRGL